MHRTPGATLAVLVLSAPVTAIMAFGGRRGGGGTVSLSGQDTSGRVSHNSLIDNYMGTDIKEVSIRSNCTRAVHVSRSDRRILGFGMDLSAGSMTTSFLGNPVTYGAAFEFRAV